MKIFMMCLMMSFLPMASADAGAQTQENAVQKKRFCILDKDGVEQCVPPKTVIIDRRTVGGSTPGTSAKPMPGISQPVDKSSDFTRDRAIAPDKMEKQGNVKNIGR